MGALLRNPMLMLLVASTAIRGVGESAVEGFLPVYLKETLEFSDTNIALVFSGAQVIGLISQPVMGFLSDRVGRKIVLVTATASLGVLSLLLSVADPVFQVVLIVLAKGAFKFSLHHIFIAAAIDTSKGEAQSTVTSFMYGAGLLGIFSPDHRGGDIGCIRHPCRLRLRRRPDAPGAGRTGPLPRSDSRLAGGGVRDR